MRIVSASELTRVRLCITPGCPNDVVKGEFCETCKLDLPARRRRGISQRAEMQRQAKLVDRMRAASREDELRKRRKIHERRQQKVIDLRARTVAQLRRMKDQAHKAGDRDLEDALRQAIDVIASRLTGRKIG